MSHVAEILHSCKSIAVVGLSPKTHRSSYQVSQYMQAQGYRIIPINPTVANKGVTILGEFVFSTLSDALGVVKQIDMINCFRNSEDIPPIAQEAILVGAKVLWMQLGITNLEAAALCENAGMQVVQDLCLKIEHHKYLT